jgi:hypothetical protein
MSKLTAIVITAAICLPLGALLRHDVAADPVGPVTLTHGLVMEGHPHLSRAQLALHTALDEIELSRQAGEPAWADRTGRVAATVDAVERAITGLDQTADWVAAGMWRNDPGRIDADGRWMHVDRRLNSLKP